MLQKTFRQLDRWIEKTNRERIVERLPQIAPFSMKLLGQMALFEAKLPLDLAATMDVDALFQTEHAVKVKFNEILQQSGRHLDALSHEIWMPADTTYTDIFRGRHFTVAIPKPEFVLISKALKAPEKNHTLLAEYLASGASSLFFVLAKKYHVDLEKFVT